MSVFYLTIHQMFIVCFAKCLKIVSSVLNLFFGGGGGLQHCVEEIKHKVVTRLSKMPWYLNLFILGRLYP